MSRAIHAADRPQRGGPTSQPTSTMLDTGIPPGGPVDAAYTAYVACFSNPTLAVLDLAGHAGIAVACLDRGAIEADTGRELTDNEWDKISHQLDWYDEHICGSGELNAAFLDQIFAAASVERYIEKEDDARTRTNN